MMVALRFRFHDRSPICIMAAEASRLMNASIIVGHILSGIGTCYILRQAYRGFNTLCDDLRGTRFHDRSPICIMAAEASRLMNASIIVGHILSGIGTCYILRQAYRGFNTLCDDLRGTRRARIQNFSNVQPAVKQVDNDPKQYLSYVQAEVQHHNDLKQNLSYWRAAVRGLDIDPNRNFVHSQRADELARIEHIIRMRGESARSMTIGEIAEELKDFGYLWQILATAEEGDVRMK